MIEVFEQGNGDFIYVLPRGGKSFPQPLTHLDRQALVRLDRCAALWPQENAEITSYIHENMRAHPIFSHWLACETAFFSSLPEVAAIYALPGTLSGHDFHAMEWTACSPMDRPEYGFSNGSSVFAWERTQRRGLADGKAMDTTGATANWKDTRKSTCGDSTPAPCCCWLKMGLPHPRSKKRCTPAPVAGGKRPKASYEQMMTAKGSGFDLAREMSLRA